MLERASGLEPRDLGLRDALHLATALSLEDDLGVVSSYDARLSDAARACGLAVESPT